MTQDSRQNTFPSGRKKTLGSRTKDGATRILEITAY